MPSQRVSLTSALRRMQLILYEGADTSNKSQGHVDSRATCRQPAQPNASATPTATRREPTTEASIPTSLLTWVKTSPGNTAAAAADSDAHQLRAKGVHGANNHVIFRDGDNSEHSVHTTLCNQCFSSTHTLSDQQLPNYSVVQGDSNIRINDQTCRPNAQLPTSTHGSLQQYLAQQQVVHNYALGVWEAETSHEGPLPLIPEPCYFSYWLPHWECESANGRGSDTETIRGPTIN